MKAFVKVTTGLAFATMALAQPVLAAAPRAMDARTTASAPISGVVSLRQTPVVGKRNKATSGIVPLVLLGAVAAGVGVAAAAGAFDDDNATSP